MAYKVIDISKHNGNIDFSKVKKEVDAVIIRAGYGWDFTKDPKLEEYVKGCNQNQIPYGLYCYSYATTMAQAKTEVKGFLETVKKYKPLLPVVIDTEDADGWRKKNGNPSWQTKADMLLYELDEIEKAGYYAMYYCSTSWYDQLIKCQPALKSKDLWLAHWGIPNPSRPCGVWQYTSDGSVNGIRGRVDRNLAYKDYPAIIQGAGLNGFKKVPAKATEPGPAKNPEPAKKEEAKKTVIVYLLDGDLANATALFNSIRGDVVLDRTEPVKKEPGTKYIQVGGAAKPWADVVLSGKNRQETLSEVSRYIQAQEGK